MAEISLVDGKRLAETTEAKNARVDQFRTQCVTCKNTKHCLGWTKIAQNCLGCKLFKESRPGSEQRLCVCLNIPTAKEREEKSCKYYERKEAEAERPTV